MGPGPDIVSYIDVYADSLFSQMPVPLGNISQFGGPCLVNAILKYGVQAWVDMEHYERLGIPPDPETESYYPTTESGQGRSQHSTQFQVSSPTNGKNRSILTP